MWAKWGVLVLAGLLAGGCGATRAAQRPPTPMATSLTSQAPETLSPNKGSIWQSTDRNSLFTDRKARAVGDLITVVVAEKSNASNAAQTKLSRDNKNEMDLGGLFGATEAIQKGGLSKFKDAAKIEGKHESTGQGQTTRDSTFTTTISCVVTEVLTNGNFRIEGRRDLTLNNENQFIMLSGVVRPEDITQNNTVKSSQIADARIEFSGEGDIADQQEPSWLNRFFANIRLF
ncbi:MAG: flagellar basal body L-ring protein FlgH [Magnetococcales bacterium]|nr:flagellar basal body L-ring protein FlgH [Magnetococcales bacterium]